MKQAHYNVKYWKTYESCWINHQPAPPTSARYYDTRLVAAKRAAKYAVDNGIAFQAKVTTTAGEVVAMYANCGQLGTGWIDFSNEDAQ